MAKPEDMDRAGGRLDTVADVVCLHMDADSPDVVVVVDLAMVAEEASTHQEAEAAADPGAALA